MIKVNIRFFILVTCWVLFSVVGCFSQNGSVTPNFEGHGESSTLTPTKNPTLNATETLAVRLTPPATLSTPEKESEDLVETVVPSITPTQVIAPSGNIYLRTPDGIVRFSLETEEVEELVLIEPDWDSLGVALSPDRQQLAYWLHTGSRTEVWMTELAQWSPELVFTASEIEHEWNGLWWLNERYLILEPGHFDPQNHLFIPVRSYLINVPQQSIEVETGSLIFGCSLAISPQSNQVATWCPAREEWPDPKLFFKTPPSYFVVLEENGDYWLNEQAPGEMLVEFTVMPEDVWSWSYQGEYAAFSTYDEVAKERTLYYIDAQGQSLLTVEDDSSYYFALGWSPDQKYLSFSGKCSVKGCNKIYDVESRQVVWTSVGLPGAENGTYLDWSHDSKYIVVQSEGFTIIDIETGERVRNFKDLIGGVIVWTP